MKKIRPYQTHRGMMKALDNGGRFYNIFTDRDDGSITPAELGRVAGVYTNRDLMSLFFDMAASNLDPEDAKTIRQAMPAALRNQLHAKRPRHYTPAEAVERASTGKTAIVTGIPRYQKTNTDFNGFIIIPISNGKTVTPILVPIMDKYDVYEVRDQATDDTFLVAHARGRTKLRPVRTRLGGIIKKLQGNKKDKPKHSKFLETHYYTPLGSSA